MKRTIACSCLVAAAMLFIGGCATTPTQSTKPDAIVNGERFVSDINVVNQNTPAGAGDLWKQELPAKPEPKPEAAKPAAPQPGPQADTSVYTDTTDDRKGKIASSGPGFPGEPAESVFDGQQSKWCNEGATLWIEYAYADGAKQKVTAYTLMSANDSPARDPKSWKLLGSNDSKEWTEVDSRKDEAFGARFEKRLFEVKTPGEFSVYKLEVTQNNGDASTQFAEFELLVKK